jgi:hypothetical protein
MDKMLYTSIQRFFAHYIVAITIGAALAFVIALADYFFAEIPVSRFGDVPVNPCWKSIFFDTCQGERTNYLALYPYFSLFITVPGYLAFRTILGSFRVVLRKKDQERG